MAANRAFFAPYDQFNVPVTGAQVELSHVLLMRAAYTTATDFLTFVTMGASHNVAANLQSAANQVEQMFQRIPFPPNPVRANPQVTHRGS